MKIDRKTNGVWCVNGVKRIDSIAYNLYVYNKYSWVSKISQKSFMDSYYKNDKFKVYYELAKIQIRKEKIEKIVGNIK